jgi:hypothetical protein
MIKQGKEEQFESTLYIFPEKQVDKNQYKDSLVKSLAILEKKYPGISIVPSGNAYKVEIPKSYHVGHEAHFSQVMEHFLGYMKNKNMPDWEIPGMIAKYYITTKAVEIASRN